MISNTSTDSICELGEPAIIKKRVRKSKKQMEKELLNEYYDDVAAELASKTKEKANQRKKNQTNKDAMKDKDSNYMNDSDKGKHMRTCSIYRIKKNASLTKNLQIQLIQIRKIM